jgi:hypothetical protein
MFLAAYAMLWNNALLRSERHSLVSRYLDLLDDSDMDQAALNAASKTIMGFTEENVPKKAIENSSRDANPKAEDTDG